jgi:hypothetical protein
MNWKPRMAPSKARAPKSSRKAEPQIHLRSYLPPKKASAHRNQKKAAPILMRLPSPKRTYSPTTSQAEVVQKEVWRIACIHTSAERNEAARKRNARSE